VTLFDRYRVGVVAAVKWSGVEWSGWKSSVSPTYLHIHKMYIGASFYAKI